MKETLAQIRLKISTQLRSAHYLFLISFKEEKNPICVKMKDSYQEQNNNIKTTSSTSQPQYNHTPTLVTKLYHYYLCNERKEYINTYSIFQK